MYITPTYLRYIKCAAYLQYFHFPFAQQPVINCSNHLGAFVVKYRHTPLQNSLKGHNFSDEQTIYTWVCNILCMYGAQVKFLKVRLILFTTAKIDTEFKILHLLVLQVTFFTTSIYLYMKIDKKKIKYVN